MAGALNINVDSNSATFNRNGSSTLDNSYYITSYGTAQGISAEDMSNETLLDNLGSGWELSDGKIIPSVNTNSLFLATIAGLRQNYIYTGSAISLAYVVKDYDGNTLVNGTHYDVTITMDGSTVSEVKDKGTYTLTITAHDGSGYIGSQSVTFEVADYVEIGDPESSESEYSLPVNMFYKSSLTQQIFTAEEIGVAGVVNSLSFEYLHTSSFSLDGIQIYMKTVGNKSSFNDNKDMVSVNASDKVWEGEFSATGAGWVTINLDTPFSYDGTENLLVCFYDPVTDSYPGSSYKFRITNTTGDMAISYYSDSYAPDLNNLSDYSGNKYAYGYRNNIRFDVDVNPIAFPSSLEVTDITAHEATLTWTDGTGTYNVEYKKTEDTEWTSAITNTNETSLTLTNLAQDAEYDVRVQSVKGEEVSIWKKNSFTTLVSCPIPTNLAVTLTEGKSTEATLGWTENGSATLWEICLNDDETSVITATTNPYTVTNLTPETVYTAKVRAVNSDEEKSRWSSAVTFEPTDKQVIGSGTGNSSFLPLYYYYYNSFAQQIYTANELGKAGLIHSIDFKNVGNAACTRDIDIYMVNTDKDEFDSESDWISTTADDLVFSGNVTFTAGSWTEIELDKSFNYDGQSNVAIIVDDNTGSYVSSGVSFLTFGTEDYSSLYVYEDYTDFNPASPGSYEGTLANYKNVIRVLKNTSPYYRCPGDLVASEIGNKSVKLSWTEVSTPAAQEWVVAYKAKDDAEYTEVTTSANPYVLENLTPETEYVVKVRPANEKGIIKWSKEVEFTTDEVFPAPANVTVTGTAQSKATISWSGIADSYEVRYGKVPEGMACEWMDDEEEYYTTIGSSGQSSTWTWGVMYPGSVLNGNVLRKIALYEAEDYNTEDITISIYSGGDDAPETLLYTEVVTPEANNEYHEIELAAPVDLPAGENLWVVVSEFGSYPMTAYYKDTEVDSNKQWFYDGDDDAWHGLNEYSSLSNYCWMIRAYIDNMDEDEIEWTVGTCDGTSCSMTNLEPQQTYIAQVRSNYGSSDHSRWISRTFTTSLPKILLANNSTDNATLVETNNGKEVNVTLTDRTLYKDGKWNTICLPFDVDLTDENSPLYGADARELTSASITDNETAGQTLHLTFAGDVQTLQAGVPYIIKWSEGENIIDPVFADVTISNTAAGYDNGESGDYRVRFLGTYDKKVYAGKDKSVLFMGSSSNLYYPDGLAPTTLGACRAYFKIGENNAVNAKGFAGFVIDLGDETTAIHNAESTLQNGDADSWHTIDGIRLTGKPSKKGMYIHKGKKVVK